MLGSRPGLVSTRLGRLHVGQAGSGPPAVLWHSLWVDSGSWGPLVDAFGAHRHVVTIDGPGYGRSDPIHRDFTLDECAQAAGEVLDHLGITEPVDWVGNAWGGHVGITLAVAQPHRLRSLVTIAAPVTPVSRRQRWTKTYPLALLYRMLGPNRLFTKILFDVLLGSEAIAAHPDRAAEFALEGLHRVALCQRGVGWRRRGCAFGGSGRDRGIAGSEKAGQDRPR